MSFLVTQSKSASGHWDARLPSTASGLKGDGGQPSKRGGPKLFPSHGSTLPGGSVRQEIESSYRLPRIEGRHARNRIPPLVATRR